MSSNALAVLADRLRAEESVISPYVADFEGEPALGLLVAACPRASAAPGEYALVIESVREGYLLHYGEPRVVIGADRDLALLAGDYLYALGLERLAGLGDLEAVGELSDLISLAAQIHAQAGAPDGGPELWLASSMAVGTGASRGHEAAKAALRAEHTDAPVRLWQAAVEAAAGAGLDDVLGRASEAVGFGASHSADPA